MKNFVLTITLTSFLLPLLAHAASDDCDPGKKKPEKLLQCVTLDAVRAHQAELQSIADANGGTRATPTDGYLHSVTYVAGQLSAAGYLVELDPFDYEFVPPVVLQQTAPTAVIDHEGGTFTGSGNGAVTGPVIAVDLADNKWFGTSSGVFKYNNSVFTRSETEIYR